MYSHDDSFMSEDFKFRVMIVSLQVMVPLFTQIARCVSSPHFQVYCSFVVVEGHGSARSWDCSL